MDNTLVLEVFVYLDFTVEANMKEGNLFPVKLKVGKGDEGLLVPFEALTLEPKVRTTPTVPELESAAQ